MCDDAFVLLEIFLLYSFNYSLTNMNVDGEYVKNKSKQILHVCELRTLLSAYWIVNDSKLISRMPRLNLKRKMRSNFLANFFVAHICNLLLTEHEKWQRFVDTCFSSKWTDKYIRVGVLENGINWRDQAFRLNFISQCFVYFPE